jgi:hypothetical protein
VAVINKKPLLLLLLLLLPLLTKARLFFFQAGLIDAQLRPTISFSLV